MAERKRKRSLLEEFVSSLAALSADEEAPRKPRSRIVPAGTYKTGRPQARPEMLGTGMAARAGQALASRGRQIEEQERGIIGR